MGRSVNMVILLGRVGKEPKVSIDRNGKYVVRFSMATNQEWKDAQTGEKREKAEWHNITLFGKVAEAIHRLIFKGGRVHVIGKLHSWSDTDKQTGDKIKGTEVQVDNFNGSIQIVDYPPEDRQLQQRYTQPAQQSQQGYAEQSQARQAPRHTR